MNQKQISVLGCGWLGLPLAEKLIRSGYTVKGSTTTAGKLKDLQQQGIIPFLVDLENASAEAILPFLQGSNMLIINIPPKVKTAAISYPDKMRGLLPYIKNAGIAKVLFVSSTSVYADGFPFPEITEDTPPNPDTESGRQLLEAEKALQNSTDFQTTIIRPAGLIGGGRHPVHHLAGRTGIVNPHAPVNLIHRNDVIQVITAVIAQNTWGEIFNIAHPQHLTRQEYYTVQAVKLNLAPPQFAHDAPSIGKLISSEKAQKLLGVRFSGNIDSE